MCYDVCPGGDSGETFFGVTSARSDLDARHVRGSQVAEHANEGPMAGPGPSSSVSPRGVNLSLPDGTRTDGQELVEEKSESICGK